MMKQFVKDYLTFTKKERIAVLVLIALIVIVTVLPYVWPYKKPVQPDKAQIENFKRQMAQLKEVKTDYVNAEQEDEKFTAENSFYNKPNANKTKGELFYFNPNTLPAEDWKRLGVRDKTIQTIQKYLAKGGKFKMPKDLSKIYGLFKNEYERLLPYVRMDVSNAFNKQEALEKQQYTANDKPAYPKRKADVVKTIDINIADTSAFIKLPGIGSKLAARIVNFRSKLGGFSSVAQLGETYGLPDSTFQLIQHTLECPNPVLAQININTADANTLRQHPYIKWNLANVIVQYRMQHGSFTMVDELQQIAILTPKLFEKIKPYLTVK